MTTRHPAQAAPIIWFLKQCLPQTPRRFNRSWSASALSSWVWAPCAASSGTAAAPKAPFARWSTLYSDALHSIFQFERGRDLARLMCVSRRWGDAVLTMPALAATAPFARDDPRLIGEVLIGSSAELTGLLQSRVRRHISSLNCCPPFELSSLADLQLLSVQMPWLSDLDATPMTSAADSGSVLCAALARFNQLRSLRLRMPSGLLAAACNSIIAVIGAMNPATMHSVTLDLPAHWNELSFAPLVALTELRVFKFSFRVTVVPPPLTDAQIVELRALSAQQLSSPYHRDGQSEFLARMLQPGHAYQWTTLEDAYGWPITVALDAPLAAVLGSLPTLTSLKAWLRSADVLFFDQLRQLRKLEMSDQHSGVVPATLVNSLSHCSQLTHLSLGNFALTAAHLEELLPAFPRLSKLTLDHLPVLDSLQCFATPSLASSLRSLELRYLAHCPPAQVAHLFHLRGLSSLHVVRLAGPVSDEQQQQLRQLSFEFICR